MSSSDGSPLLTNTPTAQAEVLCPYPDCHGKFTTRHNRCPVCRRPIALCPNGHFIAANDPFCDVCGYDGKSNPVEPFVPLTFVLSPDILRELLADAYREAALAGLNMRSATERLEAVRTDLAQESDYHKAWDKLDEHIGRTLDKRLREVLVGARERLMREIIHGEISRLTTIISTNPEHGWDEWLRIYAAALVNWRMQLAKALAEAELAFPAASLPVSRKLRQSTELVIDERWGETLPMYRYLSQLTVICSLHRAWLLVIAGEVELYQLRRPTFAKKLYDEAYALAPEDGRVLAGYGEYFVQEKLLDQAKEQIEKIIAARPESSRGYVLRGDLHEQAGELDLAGEAFEEGIRMAPGESSPYSRLLRLNGRPERFSNYKSRLLPLLEIGAVIEPLNEYSLLLDLGTAYQQNGQYDEAHYWYDRAIQLKPTRLSGYAAKGYAYLEQQHTDQAHAMFAKVIEVAPEAVDGHWGLYHLHNQGGEWQEAATAYEESLVRFPEVIATICSFLEEPITSFADFKERLFEALRADPENQTLLSALTPLADIYAKSGRTADAINLYARIREVKGADYEASYRNIVGNIKYGADDYEGAAEEYRLAIAKKPQEPVYFANLSLAYQGLKQWDKAREQVTEAKALLPEDTYSQELAAVWNAEANDYFARNMFQEAIERYEQAITLDQKNAIYRSNLSGAWENLVVEGGKLNALENAKKAMDDACALDSQNDSYKERLDNLTWKINLVATYGEHILGKSAVVTPLTIEIADDLVPFIADSAGQLLTELNTLIDELRSRISNSLGVRVPWIQFRGSDLPSGSYVFVLLEVPLVMGNIAIQRRLVMASEEQLASVGVQGDVATDPNGNPAYWVDEKHVDTLKAAGLETWKLMEYPIRHLETVIRQNLGEFIDHQEVSNLLAADADGADIVSSAEKLTPFTILIRALVSEQVPITALSKIRGAFSESLAHGKDLATIVESVRSLPEIRPALPGNNSTSAFYRFGERITQKIADGVRTAEGQQFLTMVPETCQDALAAVRNTISSTKNPVLVIEQPELRPLVRRLTEIEWPNVPVLSSAELLPELSSRIAGEIELE